MRSRPNAQIGDGEVIVDQLFPGAWDLTADFADGRRARLRFDFATFDQQLALEMRVGDAAIVDGQLLAGGKPLGSTATKRWFVWAEPETYAAADGGHALDGEGRPVGDLTDGCATADAEGKFTIGRLPAGIAIRLLVVAREAIGAATFVLAPGERRSVAIDVTPAVTVAWRMGEALPEGRITLEAACGSDPLARFEQVPVAEVGSVLASTSWPAGSMRRRATWTAGSGFPPAVRTIEGSTTLVAGRETVLELVGWEE